MKRSSGFGAFLTGIATKAWRPASRAPGLPVNLQKRAEMLGEKTFFGVPVLDFEKGGREQLSYLMASGLKPNSKVVDMGCGVLRGGYWLIHALDPYCYCGIEPHQQRLAMGISTILEKDVLRLKQPRFHTNPDFDTSVFGERFDFFLAYSIWTHASKRQIGLMLDAFLRDSQDDARFLTSCLPAGEEYPDYQGTAWYGTSHESDVPGCIGHSRQWIDAECGRRGLAVQELGQDQTHGQFWLELRRHANATPVA